MFDTHAGLKVEVVWHPELAVLGDGALIWRCLLCVLIRDPELALNLLERLDALSHNHLLMVCATWQSLHGSLMPWDREMLDCRDHPPQDFLDSDAVPMFLRVVQQARWSGSLADYRAWLPDENWRDDGRDYGTGDAPVPLFPLPPTMGPGYRQPIPAG